MFCYEISINGEKKNCIGHEDMESIHASVYYNILGSQPHMTNSIDVRISEDCVQSLRWKYDQLKVGDEVSIRLIDCDNPDAPDETVSFGTLLHDTGKKEIFCSFCGRSEDESEVIFSDKGANICGVCVTEYFSIIEEDKA